MRSYYDHSAWLAVMALGMLGACQKGAPAEPPTQEKYTLSSMTRAIPPNNVPYGPSHDLTPRAELARWLKTTSTRGGRRLPVKLPVVVVFDDSRDIGRAFVGTSADDPGHDKLPLKLDAGRMGISLKSRLRQKCGTKVKGCALWMEGYWGPSLPSIHVRAPKPRSPSQPHTFSVRRPGDLIQPGTPAKAHIAK